MVILLGGRVRPGRREDLVHFLRDAVPCYERPGGIRTRLLRDVEDPDAFVEVVEYADPGTYERNQERVASDPEMRAYLERWHALLAEAPVVGTYEEMTAELHTGRFLKAHAQGWSHSGHRTIRSAVIFPPSPINKQAAGALGRGGVGG
jgi:quinol monooxygenase YgiN